MLFDGYRVIEEVHASSRSHVYLVIDEKTNTEAVMKTPSVDKQHNPIYLERFLREEWIARRLNSPYVLKPSIQTRKRNYSYLVTEYIKGKTLSQWMRDNPSPCLQVVYEIVEQIAKGLLAFHRMEMLHQDLRPDNIMIDNSGAVKIIDFGSTKVAGISEIESPIKQNNILGTAQYTAPEYFLGESGSPRSDMFSLAIITYQMLTAQLPYGTKVAQSRKKSAQKKLIYRSIFNDDLEIPAWVDSTLKKALHPNPYKRYDELSEFLVDLRRPSREFLHKSRPSLLERHPTVFWKIFCLILTIIIIILLEVISRLS